MRFENWEISGFDRAAAVDFCREGINPLVSVFLTSRGMGNIEDARAFLGNSSCEIHDPFLLAGMDKAVSRINAAIDKGERIAVYGDYDVDGMTSCAILSLWLRSKGVDFEIYIPSRLGEGYGLNCAALDILKSHGVSLVITVDCGITAADEAKHARSLGMGLVITDHHECREELPEAEAVVDPKRPDCSYPNKALAGVGVTFKLICALERECPPDEIARKYIDLVAIGTVADVMPVLGENRELIRRGLNVLNDRPRVGLFNLMREYYAEHRKINAATVGFGLAPRLNAAGRMGQTGLSVELLLTDNEAEAERLTTELLFLNSERRRLETEIFREAVAMLPESGPDGPIVLARRGWFQGVTGIVAAKMAERYLVPAIIISIDDEGVGRGSCRSAGAFGIYGALRSCEELLDNYGGHDMATGVTIAEENIDELRRRIYQYYLDSIGTTQVPSLHLDFEVEKPELLTIRNVEALADLEPFGNGNAPPCLCIRGAALSAVCSIGAGKHTRFKIEKAGKTLDCIFFAMPSEDLGVSGDMIVDVAFEPQINEYRGRSSVQLQVFDIRESQMSAGSEGTTWTR
ncbi:MAG: single-stranded-DNA-specific exonuclease RecJ [Oscillospiraceae bacterium]|jgi:single-stranded-DNA-specific exonuclease|nr:single-stranded-DNA-specific exonuclease RecJ [Oscillospiraceae bacterium]